jgi:two-component system nitrate/nitrite response regulator NarL
MEREPVSIVVADDHPVVLHGAAGILRTQPDLNVVATCRDGMAAVDAILQLAPDVAVLDFAMPKLNGLEVLSKIAVDGCKTKVVILTAVATDAEILAAVAHGAKGIMLKDAAADSLVDCVRAVAAGKQWFPTDVLEVALQREAQRPAEPDSYVKRLTAREQQIVLLVADGLSNKEIARRIDLTEGTIKIHLHNIYEKLDVPNRTALTALAVVYQRQLRP